MRSGGSAAWRMLMQVTIEAMALRPLSTREPRMATDPVITQIASLAQISVTPDAGDRSKVVEALRVDAHRSARAAPAIRRAPAALDRVVTALMRMGAGHGFSPLHPRPRR